MGLDYLEHYGTPRHSGRYPWGSGDNPFQRNGGFIGRVEGLRKEGLSEKEIAEAFGVNTSQLRAKLSIARSEKRKEDELTALKLKDKGYSNSAIAREMGINESSVRNLLNPELSARNDITRNTANLLRDRVDEMNYIDVGKGVEGHLGVSRTRLKNSLALLKEEGYQVSDIYIDQVGTGKKTTVQVLYKPDITYGEVFKNRDKIGVVTDKSDDGGKTFKSIERPVNVNSKRIAIKYGDEGGELKDGLIELRPGVPDISLGNAKYAQVRIAVDGTHYLKGMAVYNDKLPPGVDIRFNTNKSKAGTTSKKDVMKKMKDDPENPFGASIKMDDQLILAQRYYTDSKGKKHQSALNIVNEEGNWGSWKKTIASQMLSKQDPDVAKKQLDLAYELKKSEYEEYASLTNPIIRKKMLMSFGDSCDSAAVHLKAAAFPRQESKVLIPFTDMRDDQIYAPTFKDGESVVLIRFPHGGKFEIPELTVNNRIQSAKKTLGNAKDAVGITKKVADRLSGADFDGDSVLVIPNNNKAIKTMKPLKDLENFDPKIYQNKSLPEMKTKTRNTEMGKVSNLITDMTIKGASPDELARAVKHSMVVIDAKKHSLDYKKSYVDNGIASLKAKYQGVNSKGQLKGSSTLISKASSEVRIDKVKEGKLITDTSTGKTKRVYVDPKTGKKLYEPTGESYVKRTVRKDGTVSEKIIKKQTKTSMMSVTEDARTLSSGTRIENIYADHANNLKALGNQARKTAVNSEPFHYNPTSAKIFSKEVASLDRKIKIAEMNAPLERKAQALADSWVRAAKKDNPDMDGDEIKKLKGRKLTEARITTGAGKTRIKLTDSEVQAIQAGAISGSKLEKIMANSDLDHLKEVFTPRTETGMPSSKVAMAESMLNRGYTQAEVADHLGVSVSTLAKAIK